MLNKKIILFLILIVVIALSGTMVLSGKAVVFGPSSCTLGDANGDNLIDSTDEDLLVQMIKGLEAPTPSADMNGDGYIGAVDVSLMVDLIKFVHNIDSAVTEAEAGNCDAPSADILYSTDNGITYDSYAKVKNGDNLKIKAVFSKALNDFENAQISIDNGLVSDSTMTKLNDSESVFNLPITSTDNLTAHVSIQTVNGNFTNDITLTSGTIFNIINVINPCTLGDATGDNLIDSNDEDLMANMIMGLAPSSPSADLDGDGFVSPADMDMLSTMIHITHTDPAVTSADTQCVPPTAAIWYSVDGGETYNSTATVKNGDTLKIKAIFSSSLNESEYAFLDIDNSLGVDLSMIKSDNSESIYDLLINKTNSFIATVSLKTINGVFTDNIVLTGGATFKVVNVSSGGVGASGGSKPVCETVNYSDWSACIDGKSTRKLISKNPYDCEPNSAQILDIEKTCVVDTQVFFPEGQGEVLGEKFVDEREQQLLEIYDDAHYIWPGDTNLILGYMNVNRNLALEQDMSSKYGSILGSNVKMALVGLETANSMAIINFLTYGTRTTLKLGAGERAGVLNSYKAAFNKLPKTEEEWRDAIKIANGRWPSQTSVEAENRAKVNFNLVYKRSANMANANDNAAVTTMAYGLRPLPRNLNSESAAIKIFKGVFGYYPIKATAWDVVRAIAYSGAKR